MKEKSSGMKRRKYDASFKEEVLQMISNGRPVSEVPRRLGIGANIIYRWKSRLASNNSQLQLVRRTARLYQKISRRCSNGSGNWRRTAATPYPISPNLLLERALAQRPDEVWVGDITYIPMAGGTYAYLAVWMDLYSRKITGWHPDDNMKETLVIAAFKKALMNRTVTAELIIHSDRGGQYAGGKFRKLIDSKQLLQNMSRADNPYDNAVMESCFSRFKTELLQEGAFENLQDAQTEIFEYTEMYYNTKRRHSSLNYESPGNFEKNYYFYIT